MYSKVFLLLVFTGGALLKTTAQKVIRKDMPPIQVVKKKPAAWYNLGQLMGRWQEVIRTPINTKSSIGFTDSLQMNFDSNRVEIKDATSMKMSMKGIALIDAPNILVAAGDEYSIVSLDKNRLVINDEEFTRELQKKDLFYSETVGKIIIPSDSLNTPVNIDQKNIEGKWMVYRRQALAGTVNNEAVLIKSLEVYASDRKGSALGMVTFYRSGLTESLPCKIIFSTGNILVITETHTWEFNTYKSTENEFIFGETGVMLYYTKRI